MDASTYEARRRRLLAEMGERAVAIIAAAPIAMRNNDVEHEYRQESDFYYLTGFDEPESVLLLSNVHEEHEVVFFVRARDPLREAYDGPRVGVEDAAVRLGGDAAFVIGELDAKLFEYLGGAERLLYRFGRDAAMDARVLAGLERSKKRRDKKDAPSEIVDLGRYLHEHRLHKSEEEIAIMRRALEITQRAHLAAMRVARPGSFEHEVEAELLRTFRASGSERVAYGPIVGSGANACILHYRKNDRRMEDGDLLLIDAGAELSYYASDITRTFPVNGRFSEAQRAIYDLVLETQLACIAAVRPGATLDELHEIVRHTATEGLIALGLVEGPLEKALEEKRERVFLLHRTSHWLGMDVHDVGAYYAGGEARKLAPGMVFTIEPGLYIAESAQVDARWRGIGVRIEDDILVTESGCEVLSAGIPKDADEIERLLADR